MRTDWVDLLLVVVLLTLPAIGLTLFADAVWSVLRYDRPAILDGQWWRVLTAHWVHLSPRHLIMNLAGLLLVVLVFSSLLTPRSLLLSALTGAMAVGLGLFVFSPGLYWYAGLSGVVSAIWATAGARGARCGSWLGWVGLVLALAKVLWEQLAGANPLVAQFIGGAVITDAHLYGTIAGVLVGVLLPRLTRTSGDLFL